MSGSPGAVPFDYSLWQSCFPALASTSPYQAEFAWGLAGIYLNNSACSVVTDNTRGGQRNTLLNLLTAHIVTLMNNASAGTPVGRVSNASEGSVSVAFDMPSNPNGAWFQQTQYGAMFWSATAQYRTMRYQPAPQRYLGVTRAGFGGRGW